MSCVFGIVHTMVADDLATQGARVLIYLAQTISVSAPPERFITVLDSLNFDYMVVHLFG